MDKTIDLLLHLLRCSLNSTMPDPSLQISEEEWTSLFWLARKHGVVTMINDVIEQMPPTQRPQGDIALSWALSADRTHYHYARQQKVLDKITLQAKEEGLDIILIKGMTLSKLYPHPNSRSCGDIDIYFPGNYQKGNLLLGAPDAMVDGKHSEMAVDGVTVENHLHFLDLHYRSQKKAEAYILQSLPQASPDGELPPMANMVYLLMHTVSHLTAKIKLPLRNVVDWGMFLNAYKEQLSPSECHKVLRHIGMVDAFNLLTQLAAEFIGADLSDYIIGTVRQDDAKRMREMILNKSYMESRPKISNPIIYLKVRLQRHRQRRWLYRYLPANAFERTFSRIKHLFIE